jgi:amino acid adenylation domain-containing protein
MPVQNQQDWFDQLRDLEPLQLPADRAQPTLPSHSVASLGFAIEPPLLAALDKLCGSQDATLQMGLLAVLALLLHRYCRQDAIAIGVPISGADQRDPQAPMLACSTILPIRTLFAPGQTFLDLLAQVRASWIGAHDHLPLPFDPIVEVLNLGGKASLQPLVQVTLQLIERPDVSFELSQNLKADSAADGLKSHPFDLEFLLIRNPSGGLTGQILYATDRFDRERIARLGNHLVTLLASVLQAPAAAVDTRNLLPEGERQLIDSWSEGPRLSVPEQSVTELFERQVERTPAAIAVVFGEQELSYEDLNGRANRLADQLLVRGVGPETIVALALERSAELIVALLAILKAGGAYLPLDPALPPLRIGQILADAAPAVVIGAAGWDLPSGFDRPMVLLRLDDPALGMGSQPAEAPVRMASRVDQLAYLTYTSGSTGTPKGVLIEHRGILRLLDPGRCSYALSDQDRVLQLAPLAFDAATFEIWGALLNGATLVMAPPGQLALAELGLLLVEQRISTVWLTAGLFHAMVEEQLGALVKVRQILAGGDVLAPGAVQRLLDHLPAGQRLINGYGPSESTTFTCCHPMAASELVDRGGVPIGRPIAGTVVRVVDRGGQLCPIGVPGELQIGGAGLARGYLNNPGLTDRHFIPDLWAEDRCSRLYKSGDLVSWEGDGTLAFHGRIDQQIKLRGFRIEPGEIESQLLRHPWVSQASVLLHRDEAENGRLIAYWVASASASASVSGPGGEVAERAAGSSTAEGSGAKGGCGGSSDALRAFLVERLPEYMVPAAFVELAELPLTRNGKVDRQALPAPSFGGEEAERFEPRTELEQQLHGLWAEVLGHDDFGITDHFFQVGGHSLAAARLVARLGEGSGQAVSIASLFQHSTIAGLAGLLAAAPPREASGTVSTNDRDAGTASGGSDMAPGAVDGPVIDGITAPASALVPLQPHGKGPALFVVYGWGGDVFSHVGLAQALASHRRPVHGLQAIGFDGTQPRHGSVEVMAAHYAAEIRRFQPEGPYHLLGFSAGSWYAWAVAAELCRQGASMGLVGLIDPGPTSRVHKRLLFRHPPLLIGQWSAKLILSGWWLRGALDAAGRRARHLLWSGGSFRIRLRRSGVAGPTASMDQSVVGGPTSDDAVTPAAPVVSPAASQGRVAASMAKEVAAKKTPGAAPLRPHKDRWRVFDYYVDRQNAYRPPLLPVKVHVFSTRKSATAQEVLWRFYSRLEPQIEPFFDDHHDYLRHGEGVRQFGQRLQVLMTELENGLRQRLQAPGPLKPAPPLT